MRALVVVCLLVGLFVGVLFIGHLRTQQHLHTWTLGVINGTSVDVVDLTGVCVYVSDGYMSGGIAVLSKLDLPPGTGCQ